MIKLDKLVAIVPLSDIGDVSNLTPSAKGYRGKEPRQWVIDNRTSLPYRLELKVTEHSNSDRSSGGGGYGEMKLGFSSKVLGKDYPELISKENIVQCLETIRNIGVYDFDIENVINEGVSHSIDVANYVKIGKISKKDRCDMEVLIKRKTGWKLNSKKSNLSMARNTGDEGLCIYDKENEMELSSNADFQRNNNLAGKFDGVTKVELKLMSGAKIRKALQIEDNYIKTILNADVSPIIESIKDNFNWKSDGIRPITSSQKDTERLAYLRDFMNNDGTLRLVELREDIRIRNGNASAASRTKKAYEAFYMALREQNKIGLPGQVILGKIMDDIELQMAA